jgi:hypothetical protein
MTLADEVGAKGPPGKGRTEVGALWRWRRDVVGLRRPTAGHRDGGFVKVTVTKCHRLHLRSSSR